MSAFGFFRHLEFERGAGDQRRALGDPPHLLHQLVHPGQRGRANEELGLREIGHHVRHVPAVGDDPVDARVGGDVLAQGIDPVEDLDDRVQRVDAVEGIGGSVRRSPVKADPDQHAGQGLTAPLDRRTARLGRSGVSSQRGVDAREHPCLGHDHLAADRFFGRRAKDVDAAQAAEMRQRRGEPQTGADSGNGDQVVTAAVTHTRAGRHIR